MANAQVLIIDDREISRLGRAAVLTALGLEPVTISWNDVEAALDEGRLQLDRVGLLIASMRPNVESWDRFGAVGILAKLVTETPASARIIALLRGPAIDNPMLGLRLASAGVHRVVASGDASSTDQIRRLVEDPGVGWAPAPSHSDLALLSVGPTSDPEAVVAWVMDRLLADPDANAYRNAFTPGIAQNACGLSRRKAHSMRVRLSALGRLAVSPSRFGGGPPKDCTLPRWTEVIAIANLCRGYHPDPAELDGERPGFPVGGWLEAVSS